MKAVIMAGGKGSRLRPLTWNLPKPMVPLLDRPCMEYIIDLLKRHGITDIAVTIQYLPQAIKGYFGDGSEYGVRLHYFEEETPLGTAGSVKNAQEFLDDTFIVVSGDALTDFNLAQAIDFHTSKQAVATLVMTKVDVPVEYGIVGTDGDGKITRFLEKPSWSEVFSNTVNTGIYVLEPEVLTLFNCGETFDFSKDLFPMLMRNQSALYGYVADGYWSDIGNLVQYRQTQFDMLSGLVDVNIKGNQLSPGIWISESAQIHPSATIAGPAYIGEGTVVAEKATLLPYTVAGRYTRIHPGAQVERTVIWNRAVIGPSATLQGTTVCSGVKVGVDVRLQENTAIGEKSRIGDKADVHPNVKIWPNRYIESETIQRSSLIWGKTAARSLFEKNGISGIPNLDVTPEFVSKVAAAYAACLPQGAVVTVSSDDEPYSSVIKYSAISSLLAAGIHVRDLGTLLSPIANYGCRISNANGGIHIYEQHQSSARRVVMRVFDCQGQCLSKEAERKIENAYFQEDYACPDLNQLGHLQTLEQVFQSYLHHLILPIDRPRLRQRKLKVVYGCESASAALLMHKLFEQLGCIGILSPDTAEVLTQTTIALNADVGVYVRENGESLELVTDQGHRLHHLEQDFVWETLRGFHEALAQSMTKSAAPPAIRATAAFAANPDLSLPNRDAFAWTAVLLGYLADTGMTMTQMVAPSISMVNRSPAGIR
ncbi:NTP transferase domain-containing protein [Alicyclobacillus tolerans]|uniref:sugar phosphate nucleotidyltransferase n=1 Tax=Alicyclobacillus tolerans TaxID=90970 RepID=UPI001F1AC2A9|nr:sugar phosphate nucleotidyltransferase [Alicyclobacillus tolerans]MCF8565738.1 NTP transferase domain-containing protein [Alicyclobacillus tolerans]